MAIATAAPAGPAMFRAARLAVAGSALLAPVAHAALAPSHAALPWLTAAALAAGAVAGGRAPGVALAALLAAAPLWQVAVAVLTGSADIHLVMPWLAAVAGVLATTQPATWRAPARWALPLAAWALVVAAAWPITVLRELDFARQALHGTSANGGSASSALFVTASVILAAQCQLVALLLFDWLFASTPAERDRVWRWTEPAIAVVCAVTIWQSAVAPGFLSREPWIALGRGAGGFFDANAAGALAALFGPVLAAGIALRASPRLATAAGWLALSLAAVLGSGSRTSLAAWLITAAIGLGPMRRRRPALVGALAAAVVITLAGIGLLRGGAVDGQFSAVGRVIDTARTMSLAGSGPTEMLWNRYGYGPAAAAMIGEHPWVGVGPGVFGVVVGDYGKLTRGALLPPDNAQNWWRHQWAELGVLGALPGFACAWLVVVAAWRAWRAGHRAWAWPVLSLGLMAVLSPPMQHPIMQVLVAWLLAAAVLATHTVSPAPPPRLPAWSGVAVWALALGCAAGLGLEGWTHFRPSLRAARFGFEYHYGFSDEMATPSGPARWAATRAVGVFEPAGAPLIIGVSLPHDDLAHAPVAVTLSDQHGVVCRWQVASAEAHACRFPEPDGSDWQLIRVAVDRAWHDVDGQERAAMVTASLSP